jgi:hypothetical protein
MKVCTPLSEIDDISFSENTAQLIGKLLLEGAELIYFYNLPGTSRIFGKYVSNDTIFEVHATLQVTITHFNYLHMKNYNPCKLPTYEYNVTVKPNSHQLLTLSYESYLDTKWENIYTSNSCMYIDIHENK